MDLSSPSEAQMALVKILELHAYGAYFEIMAALLFGYAGLESFKHGLDKNILGIDNTIAFDILKEKAEKSIKKIKSLSVLISNETRPTADIEKQIEKYISDLGAEETLFRGYYAKIIIREEKGKLFVNGLQSMFLLSGMFCIFILLFDGFGQFYHKHVHLLCNTLFLFSSIILILNILIFLRSFFDNWYEKSIKPFYIVFVAILLSFVSVIWSLKLPPINNHYFQISEKWIMLISTFTAISPYFFHFFKIWIRKFCYRKLRMGIWVWRVSTLQKLVEKKSESINHSQYMDWISNASNVKNLAKSMVIYRIIKIRYEFLKILCRYL